jgi:hypothetical protein
MSPEDETELVKRLEEFTKQPTLGQSEISAEEDAEMMSIARRVRKKRGSWWQLPKDFKEQPEDD